MQKGASGRRQTLADPMISKVAADKIVQNVYFTLVSRAAMLATPALVTLFGYLTFNYLQIRFESVQSEVTELAGRVGSTENAARMSVDAVSTLSNRVTVVETGRSIEKENGRTENQQILDHLNHVDDKLDHLSNSVSALDALIRNPRPIQ